MMKNVRSKTLLGAGLSRQVHSVSTAWRRLCLFAPAVEMGEGQHRMSCQFLRTRSQAWLIKWPPAGACDNAAYVVFSNLIGRDDGQLKYACPMTFDSFNDNPDMSGAGKRYGSCGVWESSTVNGWRVSVTGRQGGPRYTRILLGRDVIPSQRWLGLTGNRLDVHTASVSHNMEARKPKIYKDVIG